MRSDTAVVSHGNVNRMVRGWYPWSVSTLDIVGSIRRGSCVVFAH